MDSLTPAAFVAHGPILAMTLSERFVNDGSPTGLTWTHSSSTPTCPRRSARSFLLPILRVEHKDCRIIGEIPDFFTSRFFRFPVHPDCVPNLTKEQHRQLVFEPELPMVVVPSASPRTVFVNCDDYSGFLKLDYPFVLGRYARHLFGPKLDHGYLVSKELSDKAAESMGIFHFQEIGALEVIISNGKRSGVLFRKALPTGRSWPRYYSFCSLFGDNYFEEPRESPAILVQEALAHGGLEWILNQVIRPLVTSFWQLVTTFGFWPEAHAQNIVLGIDSSGNTAVIWRDCQGMFVDMEVRKTSLPSAPYHSLTAGNDTTLQKRSFLYDWILGHYVLDPIRELCDNWWAGSGKRVQGMAKHVTTELLGSADLRYVLPQGVMYCLSMEAPGDKHLEYLREYNPVYR